MTREGGDQKSSAPAPTREFRFTTEVPIWLDYHGKHVSVDQVVSSGQPLGLLAMLGTGPALVSSTRVPSHSRTLTPQGTFAGLLIGLAQLNCSELKLKRLCCRHG